MPLQAYSVCVSDVIVAGGKWTTYRRMAEDAIDEVAKPGTVQIRRKCCTTRLPLVGAPGYTPALFTEVAQNYVVPHRPGAIDTNVAKHLAGEESGSSSRLHFSSLHVPSCARASHKQAGRKILYSLSTHGVVLIFSAVIYCHVLVVCPFLSCECRTINGRHAVDKQKAGFCANRAKSNCIGSWSLCR